MPMSRYPKIIIYIDRIRENTRVVTRLLNSHGIECYGVTKGVCGEPAVARALLSGGCAGLADSRLSNLKRLKKEGFDCPLMLIRLPMISEADEIAAAVHISVISEIETARALAHASTARGKIQRVVLMVDVGDLREGIWPPDEAVRVASALDAMKGIRLEGLGVNLACFGGVIPTEKNMGIFAGMVHDVSRTLGREITLVSGGNSSGLPLVASGKMPPSVNSFRVGETSLLGTNAIDRSPFPGARQDTAEIMAEVVEIEVKPSAPIGERGQDAFGKCADFPDHGLRKRALLAIGRQDVMPENLTPLTEGAEIVGATSDYLVVDITGVKEDTRAVPIRIGSILSFSPGYGALLAAMTSPYVSKVFKK